MNPITIAQAIDWNKHKAQRDAQEDDNELMDLINDNIRAGVDVLVSGSNRTFPVEKYDLKKMKAWYPEFDFEINPKSLSTWGKHTITMSLKPEHKK